MKQHKIIIIASTAVLIAAIALMIFFMILVPEEPKIVEPEQQPENLPSQPVTGEPPPYEEYLDAFMADTDLAFTQRMKNDFIYYEVFRADNTHMGFILPAIGEGWGGPINMFIKTDLSGTINRIHIWHHLETPIYVVDLEQFLSTFTGFKVEEKLLWQTDVHGLTGATLTAEAIITAVQKTGQKAFEKGIFVER